MRRIRLNLFGERDDYFPNGPILESAGLRAGTKRQPIGNFHGKAESDAPGIGSLYFEPVAFAAER